MIFDTNNHSVFKLNYHLVLVIKYRRKVINDEISNRLKEMLYYISPKYNITLIEWNHDKDHVHLLFSTFPNTNISKFLSIKTQLWKEFFWSRSYCLVTTGGDPIEVIKKYIENQGLK